MTGSISLLIDSPLRDLAVSLRAVGPEIRSQIASQTKAAANPIWIEETRGRGASRLQQRVLADTSRVSVTSQNVTLMAGGGGVLSSGTKTAVLSGATEFGMNPGKVITSKSGKGKVYKRAAGSAFGPNVRRGNVAHPAAADSIPRFASLWHQTARRCLHESIERV